MNSIKFIDEVKKSDICPNNFEQIYDEFRNYQELAMKTLYEFHRVCEKNNIPYSVFYGSLLGLIRDGGQIPWDYDVDVVVPYIEKDHLIKSLKNDLNNNYYFDCIENNTKCRYMIMRITPKGYDTESLHVDVFYYIGTPDNEIERLKFAKKIKLFAKIREYKLTNLKKKSYSSLTNKIKLIIGKLICSIISLNKVMNEYFKLCLKYDLLKSRYNISADIHAKDYQIESENLWKTKIIKTPDGHELRIPENYDKILKILYDDYNKILPLETRLNELMRNYKLLHRNNFKTYDEFNELK